MSNCPSDRVPIDITDDHSQCAAQTDSRTDIRLCIISHFDLLFNLVHFIQQYFIFFIVSFFRIAQFFSFQQFAYGNVQFFTKQLNNGIVRHTFSGFPF